MSEWQGFYSTSQVSRLARIPIRTLYLWKKRRIIYPSVRVTDAEGRVDEGYSYADLAIAKLLRALRNKQLNLKSAVIALRHLYDRFGVPTSINQGWNNAHVYIIGKDVFAQKPDNWDTTLASRYGQKAEMKVLGELIEEEGALLIPKVFSDYIEINPNVMEGQPVIKDSRVPTSMLAMLFEEGRPINRLADIYYPTPSVAIERAVEFERTLNEAVITAKIRPIDN